MGAILCDFDKFFTFCNFHSHVVVGNFHGDSWMELDSLENEAAWSARELVNG